MAQKPSPLLIDILRATLQKVEQTSNLSPDDPALSELRRILLARIAELQVAEVKVDTAAGDVNRGDRPVAAASEPTLDPALAPPIAPAQIVPLIADAAAESPKSVIDAAPQIDAPADPSGTDIVS